MYLIVGLGNPGKEYELTRHNLGFRVIDALAKELNVDVTRSNCNALIGNGQVEVTKVILAKPQTFMNLSGDSVKELMNWYKIELDHLLLINDDLDLDPGKIRIKEKGNSAGHKGVESVINRIGTSNFVRIRIGIGRETLGGDNSKYVLEKPRPDQLEALDSSISAAADAVKSIIKNGVEQAMNEFNGT